MTSLVKEKLYRNSRGCYGLDLIHFIDEALAWSEWVAADRGNPACSEALSGGGVEGGRGGLEGGGG